MNTLTCDIVATSNFAAVRAEFHAMDFSLTDGPVFHCSFYNATNDVVDVRRVSLGSSAWQSWPANQTEAQDREYVLASLTSQLGLTRA